MTTTINAIDPRAGTHFTGKIFVKPHALERAVEYFGIERSAAPMYVMGMLRKAALIDADVVGEDGNRGRMYAHNRTVFIVAPNEDTVITLYPQTNAADTITSGVGKVLALALRSAQRKEAREIKQLAIRRATLSVERAECELRRLKTASINVAAAMSARIAEIDAEYADIDGLTFEAKREKTSLIKGICAFG